MNRNVQVIHSKAVEIAQRFHRAESELIDILQQADDAKVFRHYQYSSLFEYATKALKLSEANASNFITVARKSKSVPELKIAIQQGSITVSKARKITPVLTQENSSHWLELAKTLSKPKLEKEVARVAPQTLTPEKLKYVTETRCELKVGLAEDNMQKLRRVQDLVSQRTRKAVNLEETLTALVDFYLEKLDPIEKAKRSKSDNMIDAAASVPGTRYLEASLKHQINLRDLQQCSHILKNGERCENRRWLEVHHTIPISKGGSNDLSNLQTLCHSHHRMEHMQ